MPARELQEQLNTLREQLDQNPPLNEEQREHLNDLAKQIEAEIALEKADKALYEAKHMGRNNILLSEELETI